MNNTTHSALIGLSANAINTGNTAATYVPDNRHELTDEPDPDRHDKCKPDAEHLERKPVNEERDHDQNQTRDDVTSGLRGADIQMSSTVFC